MHAYKCVFDSRFRSRYERKHALFVFLAPYCPLLFFPFRPLLPLHNALSTFISYVYIYTYLSQDCAYEREHDICLLRLNSLNIMTSLFHAFLLKWHNFILLYGWIKLSCVYTPHFLYSSVCSDSYHISCLGALMAHKIPAVWDTVLFISPVSCAFRTWLSIPQG